MDTTSLKLQLPGFRFHPTEEELLDYYLKKMVSDKNAHCDIIGYLNIYLYEPWVLPGLAKLGEREWYFFVPRDRKHVGGGRPNRTTENGFWKATGSDRKIFSLSDPKKRLGLKKTLVFYKGRAPRGSKTDWVMNEFRLPDNYPLSKEIVLCKIYRKATSMKVLEQRAAMEDENTTHQVSPPPTFEEIISFYIQSNELAPLTQSRLTPMESCLMASNNTDELDQKPPVFLDDIYKDESPTLAVSSVKSNGALDNHNELRHDLLFMLDEKLNEDHDVISSATSSNAITNENSNTKKVSSLRLSIGDGMLQELQVPKLNMDWTQDSFWSQLCSPWLDNHMLTSPYANILNF